MTERPETILNSRRELASQNPKSETKIQEAEGGCGVIGLASSAPIKGKYLITPCGQMCNRGNGKGGGVAVVGCFPSYADHFAVQVGYLDLNARRDIEQKHLFSVFDIAQIEEQPFVEDYREFPRLEIEPPRVVRYFSRVKSSVLDRFASEHGFVDQRDAEEEFVFQNSFRLNKEFYGDRGDKQALCCRTGAI
jgi:glutamate synthase domain-containing protein 1